MSQGHMWPPEAGNSQGTHSPLEPPEGTRYCQPLSFPLGRPISDCWPQMLRHDSLLLW